MRAVVLMFESNAAAREFISSTEHRVEGMYAIPTVFCQCPPEDEGKPGRMIARGEKFGWDVHRLCGRPIEGNHLLPKNLIDGKQQGGFLFPLWELIGRGGIRG